MITRYLSEHPAVFDPATVQILGAALDDAWRAVEAEKTKFKIDGNPAAARDVLAKHLIEMAQRGELDRERLVAGALARLRL